MPFGIGPLELIIILAIILLAFGAKRLPGHGHARVQEGRHRRQGRR
jgi:Sec-independent protein translocase protein TatA